MAELLRAENLSVGYGKTPVLKGVSFEVHPGEIVTLIGSNGSGKSTLLKTAAGLLKPLGGEIFLDGRKLGDIGEAELSRHVSILLTGQFRTEYMTGKEAVSLGRYPYTGRFGILSGEDREKVKSAMELVKVGELENRYLQHLSDGQRQRVMLARAICQESALMILDEPATYLDIRYELELLEILKTLAKERGTAVFMSMHELHLAGAVSDRLLAIKNGGIFREGTPEEILTGECIAELYDIDKSSFFKSFGEYPQKSR
ncbi:MAG: ABC transporter ATP-binding protein [Lachnospiraceae bacterium]|nr:ABC transporter ATP-binding protein [Lachnospiraceae bacterium]